MISEFGEDRNSYCSFEPKDTALLQSENGSLQQRVNMLTLEVRGQTHIHTSSSFWTCYFVTWLFCFVNLNYTTQNGKIREL